MNRKAYRYWSKVRPVFWVAGVKGKNCDWEYTAESSEAIYLSEYWQRRFDADCRAVGAKAHFVSD